MFLLKINHKKKILGNGIIFGLVLTIIPTMIILGNTAFATSFSVDKSNYYSGDDISLTGSVSPYKPGVFVSLQILNPSKSDFAQIDTFLPNSDGSFSKIYKADGPKWSSDGKYTLKIFYDEKEFQTTFQFSRTVEPEQESKSKVEPETKAKTEPNSKPYPELNTEPQTLQEKSKQGPKTHIPGFPSLDEPPQYYFDRYENESAYKKWFDSQFPGKTIKDVVGYKPTHVIGFPDEEKSPAYYVERYELESTYKEWFDSQFPGKTVYQILGFPDPKPVPEWIKNNAEWWSRGQISDDDFISGIQYMIENNIIVIPNIPDVIDIDSQEVPDWVRNNASWWALDKISEEEFLNAIKYLIENGVIPVNQ